jgi:ABC-type uncharacterized transport system substrate-binding protein
MRRRKFIAGLASAVTLPTLAWAQKPLTPVIGFLESQTAEGQARYLLAFRQGLSDSGYLEGKNLEILYRWGEGRYDQLPALAADLVRRQVSVIVASNGPAPALAAKAATSKIPIVLAFGSDPVELGLVTSLSRPGGNVTGVTSLVRELYAKRFELLHQVVPSARLIGFLDNPTALGREARNREVEIAARTLGLGLVALHASNVNEIEAAFDRAMELRVGAALIGGDPLFFDQSNRIAMLAARYSLPAIYAYREAVTAGGLVSYGADTSEVKRLAGKYAGRILNGELPADLPVQQSTKVELVINLKTAKALGLTISETLLATADEVIQ